MSACRRGLLPLLLLITTISIPCAGWARQGLERFEYSEIVMGVEARIVLYAPDEATGRRAARSAFDRLADLDAVMSDHRPDSELARLCRRAGAGRGPVTVSDDLRRVLALAQTVSAASDGAFDVTVGPLVELWRQGRLEGRLPDAASITAARRRVGWRHVIVDAKAGTVELTLPSMRLDLGGIGKGFAADETRALLCRAGTNRCLVDVGGDIAAGDPPPGAAGWRVAIAAQPGRTVTIAGQGIAASSDTEQYVEIDGARYSHIVDPRTGLGLTNRAAIAVLAPDAATADALASAISVLEAQQRSAVLDQFPGATVLASEVEVSPEVTPLVIREDEQGAVVLAAIDATVHGHTARYESAGSRDHIGDWSDPEDAVSWTFELKAPGQFRVAIEYACAPGKGGGIFRLASGPFELRGRIEQTGSWTNFRTMELGLIHFEQAHAQELRVETVRLGGPALMNLRRVTLQRVDDRDRPLRRRKVLLIGIDGLRADAVPVALTPRLDRLIADGCWTDQATTTEVTVSGPAWSSLLTGVWPDKHGVRDNTFEGADYARYPHFFARLQEARPDAFTVSALDWIPLDQHIVDTAGADVRFVWDYEDGGDEKVVAAAIDALLNHDPDIVFVYFADLDVAGHEHGYHPSAPGYVAELEQIDGQVGLLIDAVRRRSTVADEDWLTIVGTDHGGTIDGSHGRDIPLHRHVPLIVSGPAAARGRLHTTANVVDIPVTALAHLGVPANPSWGLDGRPIGLAGRTPFGVNLIFNGDAEHGGGHDAAARNAGIAGWTDTGAMTVIRYGAPNGFPGIATPGPDRRGVSFFCGGKSNISSIRQVIDVADIADEVDASLVVYALTGWFGGYSDQRDLASLTARFLDERGGELAVATIGHVTVKDRRTAFGGEGDELTGFLPKAAGGRVPPETRRIELRLMAEAGTGDNDGYADNLALVLQRQR